MVCSYKRKTTPTYDLETLRKAVDEVKAGKINSYQAAKKYNILRMTICDRVNNKNGIVKESRGPPTVIDRENELKLANGLRVMEKYGFRLTSKETLDLVAVHKAKKQKKCFDYDKESESELDISFAEDSSFAELSDEDFDTYRENFIAEIKSDDNFLEDLLQATTGEKENDKSYVKNDVDTTNIEQFEPNLNKKNLEVSDWILVRFTTKKSVKYFVGTIISINDNNIPNVKFLRKIKNSKFVSFHYPDVEDISEVKNDDDIIMFLEKPDISRRGHITFKENFKMYNIH
ncbi:unnamed protein product [Parnassius apollo]|uniref:(apollo) hypothetical protein n=1 Tax=Parnassius apollo TaxID=110799 RepID=A0A8S3X4D1_PARAO|nr:unnamed protein product [Parnassius apollo]